MPTHPYTCILATAMISYQAQLSDLHIIDLNVNLIEVLLKNFLLNLAVHLGRNSPYEPPALNSILIILLILRHRHPTQDI